VTQQQTRPSDRHASVSSTGYTFQLSFPIIQFIVLIWGIGRYRIPEPADPLEELIDSTRPAWFRTLRAILRVIAVAYLVNFILFAVNTPLLITEQNLASPVALLVGPVLVLLTSVALVAGFLLFLLAPFPGAGDLLGLIVEISLATADRIVGWASELPGGAIYLPALPHAWLVGFYGLIAVLVLIGRSHWRPWLWALLAGSPWESSGLRLICRVQANCALPTSLSATVVARFSKPTMDDVSCTTPAP